MPPYDEPRDAHDIIDAASRCTGIVSAMAIDARLLRRECRGLADDQPFLYFRQEVSFIFVIAAYYYGADGVSLRARAHAPFLHAS